MIELVPKPKTAWLDVTELFGRDAPLHVDLGCGDGSFLTSLARHYPHRNFLGIERLLRRARSSSRKAATLANVRIIRSETVFMLRHLLPPDSVEAFYLLFPDPWPKRRHRRRRLVTPGFLELIWQSLANHGTLTAVTDHRDYFDQIEKIISESAGFSSVAFDDTECPRSTFEKRFTDAGLPIYRLKARKILRGGKC